MFYIKPIICIFITWFLIEIFIIVFLRKKAYQRSVIVYYSAVNTFIMYMIAVFSLTIIHARSGIRGINLIPFQDLISIYKHIPYDMAEGYILNVLLFVPYGYLLPFIKKKPFLKQTVLCSFLLSLCIELLQFLFKRGIFDIDDLICNTVGGLIGGTMIRIFRKR